MICITLYLLFWFFYDILELCFIMHNVCTLAENSRMYPVRTPHLDHMNLVYCMLHDSRASTHVQNTRSQKLMDNRS